MAGVRKFKAWLITEIMIFLIFGVSIFSGVAFTPESITTIILIASTLSGAFFTANFGEHWADTKKVESKARTESEVKVAVAEN